VHHTLKRAFARYFHYPPSAVRRGWQGEVRLGLHIGANGRLSNIRVVHTSGYGILDRAALRSLGKVDVLPEAVALLNGDGLELVLPIHYRLL
jgi:protein TonB